MSEGLAWLAQMDWATLALLIVGVVAAWFILRFIFQLAVKVFTCGCLLILLVVIALVVWRLVQSSY